jgi:hypothetical protein
LFKKPVFDAPPATTSAPMLLLPLLLAVPKNN